MNSWHFWRVKAHDGIEGLGLLALRIWVAQEFWLAGLTKVQSGWRAPEWFVGLAFPWPHPWLGPDLNWLVAGVGELLLSLALIAGLGTRWAALGLLYITYVAVYTVHFDLGWAGWNQIETEQGMGFKVPLMLAVMLLALVSQGGGRYALDRWRTRQPFTTQT
jgi:putative oxidoreductase